MVRKPVATIGDINAEAIAVLDELALQIGTHAVKHLELEIVAEISQVRKCTPADLQRQLVRDGGPISLRLVSLFRALRQ